MTQLEFNNDNWLADDHPTELALDRLAEVYEPGETMLVLLPLAEDFFDSAPLRAQIHRLEEHFRDLDGIIETSSPLSARRVLQLPAEAPSEQVSKEKGEEMSEEDLSQPPVVLEIGSFRYALDKEVLAAEADDSGRLTYRQAFSASPYAGRLLDADARLAAIQLRLDSRENNIRRQHLTGEIEALLGRHWGEQYWLVGAAAIKNELNQRLSSDTIRILAIALLGTLLLLRLLLSTWARAALIACCAAGCTAAAMAWLPRLGLPATAPTLILPVVIITVGVADSLHLLLRWDQIRVNAPSPAAASLQTLKALWLPCMSASVTTAIGCGAFVTSEILIMSQFSLVAALAVLISYPLMLGPLMLSLALYPQWFGAPAASGQPLIARSYRKWGLPFFRHWGIRSPHLGLWTLLLPCGLLSAGLVSLHTESNFLAIFFAEDEEIRHGFHLTDSKLGGSGTIDVLLQSQNRGYFRSAEALQQVLRLEQNLAMENVNRIDSYALPLRQVHPHLAQTPGLPSSDEELEQEIFFLELSRNEEERGVLEPYNDFSYSGARLDLSTPDLLSRDLAQLLGGLRQQLEPSAGSFAVTLTGFGVFLHSLSELILQTQLVSIGITAALIALLFLLQFGPALALAGMVANLLPLATTAGLVSWLGLPYDFGTILVIGITAGFAVDDTLHLLHAYRHAEGSVRERLLYAQEHAGSAILAACLALGAGLLFLLVSDLVLIDRFAVFATFGLLVSLFCTLQLLPALMLLTTRLLNR